MKDENPRTARESQEWLAELSNLENLWMIAAVMGLDEPLGVNWGPPFQPGPITLDVARDLFNEATRDQYANHLLLDDLLSQMDGVPHAVLLLAGAAIGFPDLADSQDRGGSTVSQS